MSPPKKNRGGVSNNQPSGPTGGAWATKPTREQEMAKKANDEAEERKRVAAEAQRKAQEKDAEDQAALVEQQRVAAESARENEAALREQQRPAAQADKTAGKKRGTEAKEDADEDLPVGRGSKVAEANGRPRSTTLGQGEGLADVKRTGDSKKDELRVSMDQDAAGAATDGPPPVHISIPLPTPPNTANPMGSDSTHQTNDGPPSPSASRRSAALEKLIDVIHQITANPPGSPSPFTPELAQNVNTTLLGPVYVALEGLFIRLLNVEAEATAAKNTIPPSQPPPAATPAQTPELASFLKQYEDIASMIKAAANDAATAASTSVSNAEALEGLKRAVQKVPLQAQPQPTFDLGPIQMQYEAMTSKINAAVQEAAAAARSSASNADALKALSDAARKAPQSGQPQATLDTGRIQNQYETIISKVNAVGQEAATAAKASVSNAAALKALGEAARAAPPPVQPQATIDSGLIRDQYKAIASKVDTAAKDAATAAQTSTANANALKALDEVVRKPPPPVQSPVDLTAHSNAVEALKAEMQALKLSLSQEVAGLRTAFETAQAKAASDANQTRRRPDVVIPQLSPPPEVDGRAIAEVERMKVEMALARSDMADTERLLAVVAVGRSIPEDINDGYQSPSEKSSLGSLGRKIQVHAYAIARQSEELVGVLSRSAPTPLREDEDAWRWCIISAEAIEKDFFQERLQTYSDFKSLQLGIARLKAGESPVAETIRDGKYEQTELTRLSPGAQGIRDGLVQVASHVTRLRGEIKRLNRRECSHWHLRPNK